MTNDLHTLRCVHGNLVSGKCDSCALGLCAHGRRVHPEHWEFREGCAPCGIEPCVATHVSKQFRPAGTVCQCEDCTMDALNGAENMET